MHGSALSYGYLYRNNMSEKERKLPTQIPGLLNSNQQQLVLLLTYACTQHLTPLPHVCNSFTKGIKICHEYDRLLTEMTDQALEKCVGIDCNCLHRKNNFTYKF